MLHLLCTLARLATTSVAGGAALSYNQLAGADAASARFDVRCSRAAPLSSRPLGALRWYGGGGMKWLIARGAVAVGIAHLAWPALTIDGITIAVILIALSPWLGEIYKAIEFPGGLKIEYHDLEKVKERARSAGLLSPKEGVGGGGEGFSFELIRDRDPNLALAGLRIEIETRLNRIAQASGIP